MMAIAVPSRAVVVGERTNGHVGACHKMKPFSISSFIYYIFVRLYTLSPCMYANRLWRGGG